ncbi:MAG: nucleotide exchange factor GrpE [Acidobacteriota bacterium]
MNDREATPELDDDADTAPESEIDDPDEAGAEEDQEGRLEALEAEVADLRDQLLRKQADLVNFRRRMERERRERAERARAELLQELLPMIDDFERAAGDEGDNIEAYREGVEMILAGLHETLRRLGVERIEPVGEPFDPTDHEAVEQTETDEVPAGHVVSVYKPGYRMGDRLLRAAMVGVATAPDESERD